MRGSAIAVYEILIPMVGLLG